MSGGEGRGEVGDFQPAPHQGVRARDDRIRSRPVGSCANGSSVRFEIRILSDALGNAAAGCDPLRDEGVACGETLCQTGVPVQHRDCPEQLPVFWSFGARSEASGTQRAYSARPTSANFGMMSLHSIPTEARQPCQSSI